MAPRTTHYSLLPLSLFSFLAFLPHLPLAAAIASSSASSLPKIDFNAIGNVAVVGNFGALSLFDPTTPTVTFSSNASTLVARSEAGVLANLGETNVGGVVSAICQSPGGPVFVGGTFTSFAGVAVSNIAEYDPATRTFSPLGAGLDDAVLALSCNSSIVYAGGNFNGPVGAATGSYGGHVAAWSIAGKAWSALPFSGLNGPVETIAPSADGKSLFFGGAFTTAFANGTVVTGTKTTTNISDATNGTIFASLGSSLTPISLNGSEYTASPTSYLSGFGRPEYAFCPKGADGISNTWLMVDGADGSFISRLTRPLRVRGIRLGNTFFEGRGTRNFSLTSIPDNTVLELTYASNASDPTSALATCMANCVLAHDPSVPYQDFLFPANWTMTGFELDIFGHYGAGAGLHLLQLLSDGAYDYAVAANNLSPCTEGLAASAESTVSTTGNWTEQSVYGNIAGTNQAVLFGAVPGGTAAADAPSLTWTPVVTQDGAYEIFLVTPGCQPENNCPERTSVSVVVTPNGGASTTTIIDQTNLQQESTSIYSGNLVASSATNGGLTVTLGLASSGTTTPGTTYFMIADLIYLVAASTNGTVTNGSSSTTGSTATGRGIFEFALVGTGAFGDAVPAASALDATSTLTNATGLDNLSFFLSNSASVNSIVSVGSDPSARVFIGGAFTYSENGVSSANVVEYSKSVVTVAPNGGLAGTVTSLVELNGYIYAAGSFTQTSDGTVQGLAGAARWQYTSTGTSWTPLSTVPSIGGSIADLGLVNTGANDSIVAVGGGGSGLAFFNPNVAAWNTTAAGFFIGNLTAFGGSTQPSNMNASTYFAGNIVAASSHVAPGGGSLSSSGNTPAISPFGFTLNSSAESSSTPSTQSTARRSSIPTKRSLLREAINKMTPRSPGTPQHSLVERASDIVTSLPSAFSSATTGEILTGAFWKNGSTSYILLAGHFASSSVRNVGLYDLNRQTLKSLTGETISGTVMTSGVFDSLAWIGGNFTTASGRQGLATYDLSTAKVDETRPALTGYTGTNATVNVVAQRPGFDTEIVVAGAFASAGSLACQSICSWDTKAMQWTSFGSGLQGVVGAISFTGSNSQYLLAAGSFLINDTTTYLAQWNYQNSSWTIPGHPADLPGPATAVSADGTNDAKIFVAGMIGSDSPYFFYWNGTTWASINSGGLQTGSGVQQLLFVPLTNDHNSNSIIEKDRMLMVSGDLTINSTSASTALFDGETWYPYLTSTSTSGGSGVVSQFFYSITTFSLAGRHHRSVGIVILISIVIALGVVFLLVIIGILIAFARRSEEPSYPPPAAQHREMMSDLHIKHHPTALLEAVGAATAVMLDGKGNTKEAQEEKRIRDHDSIAGPVSFDGEGEGEGGAMSWDSHGGPETGGVARARYSFTGEHVGELSVSAGEDLVILEASDANWYLVANDRGQRGLMPASYLAG
ncbi:hypothetical protein P7C70_g3422, partial [Phenoliferia sp. Uapishka_3]